MVYWVAIALVERQEVAKGYAAVVANGQKGFRREEAGCKGYGWLTDQGAAEKPEVECAGLEAKLKVDIGGKMGHQGLHHQT